MSCGTTMAGSCIGLIVVVLTANAVCGVVAQQCESASVKEYVERRENATRAVINDIKMIAGNLGLNVSSQSNATSREEVLYDSLTDSFGLEKSNNSFSSFSTALTTITDAYFQSCFGPEASRPTLSDASSLIHALLSELLVFTGAKNQSLLTTIRNTFGRLTCLINRYPDQTIAPTSASPTQPNCSNSNTLTLLNFRQCINSTQIQPIFGLGPLVVVEQMVVQSRRCVGFVVDDTGSMGEEIGAVRMLILNFIATEQDLPACYVLVTFNDYGAATPIGST